MFSAAKGTLMEHAQTSRMHPVLAVLLAAALAMICGAREMRGAGKTELTISAAVSLTASLQKLRSIYMRQNSGISIALNLGASGILQQQIEQGAPADVFISASPLEMNELEDKGLLINRTRHALLRNTLVLICPATDRSLSSFQDLLKPRIKRVAMANPESVPAGLYAKQTLEFFKIYSRIQPKIIRAQDVRQALAYVETGDVDAGIVYSTEAKLSRKVRVAATAPDAAHAPIIYPVAVLKSSRHPRAAEAFVHFLLTSGAQTIFAREGFKPASR